MKQLGMNDREQIQSFCEAFMPYSDFHFTSLWCWNINNAARFAFHDESLVIQLPDYLSGDPVYSFLGRKNVLSTARELELLAFRESAKTSLSLVPEETVKELSNRSVKIVEDRDNFDYVYDLKRLAEFTGSSYARQRNKLNKFEHDNKETRFVQINFESNDHKKILLQVNSMWEASRGYQLENEIKALDRLLDSASYFDLTGLIMFVVDRPIGFIINEKVNTEFSVSHFAKTDLNFDGATACLMRETARELLKRGSTYLNYEQDLGLKGLRTYKESFSPVRFLKKYTIGPIEID